ncbi:hypothetical protein SGM_6590 [Streptomyces griseoaurantiacus M045]|uniref:Uncharacterized protein n=1 Tax=Streptomyces griseoaurantiacus M045 TaxID=996637 RepID=F3NT97_9ACTN|nr:hypothetical protein SGM_6590 [Streptomyces griseoaurantiacus M045]
MALQGDQGSDHFSDHFIERPCPPPVPPDASTRAPPSRRGPPGLPQASPSRALSVSGAGR